MPNSVDNKKPDGSKFNPILVAVVGAFLGSTGTISIFLGTPLGQEVARPDPFTGTQAASLIHRVESAEADISGHMKNHPDVINHFDRRITTLEVQFSAIITNQERILRRLEDL